KRLPFFVRASRDAALGEPLHQGAAAYGVESVPFERAFVERDRVLVRVHACRGVAGALVPARGRFAVTRGPPVIRERLERRIPRRAFERLRDRAVQRAQLGDQKLTVDRVAREAVTESKRARSELLDELKVAR